MTDAEMDAAIRETDIDVARRFAIAYLSVLMGTTYETQRKHTAGTVGKYWIDLAKQVREDYAAGRIG